MLAFGKSGVIALGGLLTSLITAVLVTIIGNVVGINIFTFSILLVLPVGAVLCGAVAASGYYIASVLLHKRPSKVLLVQMIAIAAFTQILIYYLEYSTMVVDGVPVPEIVSFGQYLDITLTKAHYGVGRAAQVDTGEVGTFGYWLAAFQFVGFIAGSIFLYLYLSARRFCEGCDRYYTVLRTKCDIFANYDEFASYYDSEFAVPVDSSEFAAHVSQEYNASVESGVVKLQTRVLGCPSCKHQIVNESVEVFGQDWKQVAELSRNVAVPEGIDVAEVYGGDEPNWVRALT